MKKRCKKRKNEEHQQVASHTQTYTKDTHQVASHTQTYTKDTQNVVTHTQTYTTKETENNKTWNCNYCNRQFTTNSSMNRHIRMFCKEKNTENNKLQNRVNTLEDALCHVIDNSNYNINSNNTISTTNNTINNHITINAFGNEDVSHLIPHVIVEVIRMKSLSESIETWTKLKYNDIEKHPENCTVQIPQNHTKYAEVSAGDGSWTTTTKNKLINEITEMSYIELKKFILENPHCFGVSYYDRFQRYFEVTKELKNNVECALISKKFPSRAVIDIDDIIQYS